MPKLPTMSDGNSLAERLRGWLDAPSAPSDLTAYFHEPALGTTDGARPTYTGRWFERLGGGGDRPPDHDHFTPADLLAVEMLSVEVPPEVSIDMLHGSLGRDLADLLARVPVGVAIGDPAAAALLSDGSSASLAWARLEGVPGIGWVTAGKLLARKRPHLVPVYDDVVRCALGAPSAFWATLQRVYASDQGPAARIAELRIETAVPAEISDLRVADVVVWMGHHGDHRRTRCPKPGPAGNE